MITLVLISAIITTISAIITTISAIITTIIVIFFLIIIMIISTNLLEGVLFYLGVGHPKIRKETDEWMEDEVSAKLGKLRIFSLILVSHQCGIPGSFFFVGAHLLDYDLYLIAFRGTVQ